MIAELVEHALGVAVTRAQRVGGGDVAAAYRVTLADRRTVFAKTRDGAPAGFFAAEARGLELLADAAQTGGAPAPRPIAYTDGCLVLPYIEPGSATRAGASDFGRALAKTHLAGCASFGAPEPGFIGRLPLDNTPSVDWAEFYAQRRLAPYLEQAVAAGTIDRAESAVIAQAIELTAVIAGESGREPARLIHGDLWSGNVLFDHIGTAYLIDPAAHGGHRETDLAMLQLFGAPELDLILAAYDAEFPLAPGWRDRVPLHQLHPVLVHAVTHGRSYGRHAASLAAGLIRRFG